MDCQFNLQLSPYLDNSTSWWIDNILKAKYSMLDFSDQQRAYAHYRRWMSDQGVIIRDTDKTISDDNILKFVDEQSMLIFALRWGN